MATASDYLLGSNVECERLERQGLLHGTERILDHVHLLPGQRFLDAGCGSGWVVRFLAERFPETEFVAIDFNADYVGFARARAAERHLNNLTFVVADLSEIPLPDRSFDTTWSQFVLYHVPDPFLVLSELVRVTRRGGTVIASAHERPTLGNYPEDPRLQPLMEKLILTIMHGWTSSAFPTLFARAGLIDLQLAIEVDTVFTKLIGPIDAMRRRNIEEVFKKPIEALADVVGGAEASKKLLADWLAYFDRPDTTSVTTYWLVKGSVPASQA
jgi:ubiquinone/menaquinone biosynthesis C-methylase UbiE